MASTLDNNTRQQNADQQQGARSRQRRQGSQRQEQRLQRSENLEQVAIKTSTLFRQVFSSTLNRINKNTASASRNVAPGTRSPESLEEDLAQQEGKVLNILDKLTERLGRDVKLEAHAVDLSGDPTQTQNQQYATNSTDASRTDLSAGPAVIESSREQPDIGKIGISEYGGNEIAEQLTVFRSRNQGAKQFDDFARGIQTWLSTIEVKAIKRFHELHIGPIEEAFEEYITRTAMALTDLIMKALLLSKLKRGRKAARRVASLAMKKIEKLMEELNVTVPMEMLFTWKALQAEDSENELDYLEAEQEPEDETGATAVDFN